MARVGTRVGLGSPASSVTIVLFFGQCRCDGQMVFDLAGMLRVGLARLMSCSKFEIVGLSNEPSHCIGI